MLGCCNSGQPELSAPLRGNVNLPGELHAVTVVQSQLSEPGMREHVTVIRVVVTRTGNVSQRDRLTGRSRVSNTPVLRTGDSAGKRTGSRGAADLDDLVVHLVIRVHRNSGSDSQGRSRRAGLVTGNSSSARLG